MPSLDFKTWLKGKLAQGGLRDEGFYFKTPDGTKIAKWFPSLIEDGNSYPPTPATNYNFELESISYYDPNIPYNAGITLSGKRPITYTTVNTTNLITADSDGIQFSSGQYLQGSPTGSIGYDRMMLLVEVTITGNTASNAIQVDQDTNQRMILRITGNGDLQGQGPGNVVTPVGDRVVEMNNRQVFAFIWDRTGLTTPGTSKMATISNDGYMLIADNNNTMDPIVLNNMRIGQSASFKLHRMALLGVTGTEPFADTPIELWKAFAKKGLKKLDTKKSWVFYSTGHSLNACRPLETGLPSSLWTSQDREGTKMLGSLLNTSSQTVQLEGPLWSQINTSVPATVVPAVVSGNMTNMSAASVALHKWKFTDAPEHLVMCSAAGGAEASNLLQGANTGYIYNNSNYMISEAARLYSSKIVERVVMAISIGTSDRADLSGVYYGELQQALTQHRALLTTAFPSAAVTEIIYQSPGRMDTTVDPWENVINAEYDLATLRNSILVPLYPFEATGFNEHPDAIQGTLYGETAAWAITQVLSGKKWTINKPTISVVDNLIILDYNSSLNSDETLSFLPDTYYDVAPANKGFELVGGTITSVNFSNKTIVLTFTGTPTKVRYANQRQVITGQRHFGFRGTCITSNTKQSAMFPDRTLYKHLPAFEINL